MERLRILSLINDLGYGGAEMSLAALVNQLNPNRFDLWVGGLFGLGPVRERFSLPDKRLLSFDFHRPFYHLDFPAHLRLVRFLRQNNIQIIHTHLPQANTIGRIDAILARVPIIVSTEHNTYLQRSRRGIVADHLLAAATTQLIAISQAVKSFSSRQSGIAPDRFMVIPESIPLQDIPVLSSDERRVKKRELGLDPSQLIVISIGRLTKQKGFFIFLDAARQILEQRSDVQFIIVGSGSLKEELIEKSKQLHIDEHVHFLGFRSDIYDLLQISTLFVLPSLWEGLGVVLLEAGACSLPVVASRVGGVPEIVQSGRNGILVPAREALLLAEAIEHLLNSPDERDRMGRENRMIVEKSFSSGAVAKEFSFLYDTLWSKYKVRREN